MARAATGGRPYMADGGFGLAIVAGVVACWLTAAILAALLIRPAHTMDTLQRFGTRGVPAVLQQGSLELLAQAGAMRGIGSRESGVGNRVPDRARDDRDAAEERHVRRAAPS